MSRGSDLRPLPVDQFSVTKEHLLEQLGIGLVDADMRSGKVEIDLPALQFFGGTSQRFVDGVTFERLLEQVHSDDRTRVKDCIGALDPTSSSFSMEYRTTPDLDTTYWVLFRGRGYFDDEEALLRIVGVVINITVLKTDERAVMSAFPVGERLVDLADLIIAARRLVDSLQLDEMRPLVDELLIQLGMKLGAQMKSQARSALQ